MEIQSGNPISSTGLVEEGKPYFFRKLLAFKSLLVAVTIVGLLATNIASLVSSSAHDFFHSMIWRMLAIGGAAFADNAMSKSPKKIVDQKVKAQTIDLDSKNKQLLTDNSRQSKEIAKFEGEKKVLVEEEKITTTYENVNLKYVIEYDINSITNPNTINFYIYKINTNVYGELFKTNYFTEFTELPINSYILLNDDNTNSTPTLTVDMLSKVDFSGSTLESRIIQICSEIRTTLTNIKDNGFIGLFNSEINKKFDGPEDLNNIYPFFFRPTYSLRTLSTSNPTELNTKNNLLLGVKLSKNIQQSSLVWSNTSFSSRPIFKTEKVKNLKKDNTSKEQTFGSITSDKIYLVSTDTNFTNKTIEFDKLNSYEYEQDDYLSKIDPNTYATVRGENLYNVLVAFKNLMDSHIHNINRPLSKGDENWIILDNLMSTLENELLNKSIRIN